MSFDFTSDLDLARTTFAGFGIQRGERADFATSLTQALKTSGAKSDGIDDFGILLGGATWAFIGEQKGERALELTGILSCLLYTSPSPRD